ncbi:NAD(P)H-binding protein [Couchioplanes azureus]|uniref:NAD(P)H-binding protein n=1 Tax=Couchioplanes caeruleus TaxID=56438 RepID=UPI00167173CF|nr:NAD(P)H-binding protein [Couchioplanes caeruleus]GGQ86019.1 nucleotide-diphosphate-sugar epimerase [Couchioplanes caeruleus subsp. azureus]
MEKPFLVTGATGHVGHHVVGQLVAAGARVRASTRKPQDAAFASGVEVVQGDLTEPASMVEALRGVERMYLFPVPETAREVVELARQAGVQRIVVLSSSSVTDEANHSGQYHLQVERAVTESGLEWTMVRPDEFATNVLWKWGHGIRAEGVVRAPYPNASRALIHEADVAAVAAAALLEDAHVGKEYELTGPAALTQVEQVRLISTALGREIRFEEISPEAAREQMGMFMPLPVVDMVLGYLAESIENPPLVLPTVETIVRRPGLTFAQWARDHVAEFRPVPAGA